MAMRRSKSTAEEIWTQEQQYHGGQEWALIPNYVCDFSVTTNCFGVPQKAINIACDVMKHECIHYPAADFEPALSKLATYLTAPGHASIKPRFTLGNGLSELIDIVTRMAPPGPWRPGPYYRGSVSLQYKEYERAAKSNDRRVLSNSAADEIERESISALVNPSNPSGDYMSLDALMTYIEQHAADGSYVLVDESMLPWQGPNWLSVSLLSCGDWIAELLKRRGVHVFILHSWTKIWACPGLRVGSIVAPSVDALARLRKLQVPWSLNSAAIAFLANVVDDHEYMAQTWAKTSEWRAREVDTIARLRPAWRCHGQTWSSWIWIDCGSEREATRAVELAKAAGVPIRHGLHGYQSPTCIRIGVREPKYQDVLFAAWAPLAND